MFEILAYWFGITLLTALYFLPVAMLTGTITESWLERILRKSDMENGARYDITRKLHNFYITPVRFLDGVGGEFLVVVTFAISIMLWISTFVGLAHSDAYNSSYVDGVIWWFNTLSTIVAPYISYVVPFIVIGIIAEWVIPKTVNTFLKVQKVANKLI